jgi:hypothetical protein
MSSAFENPIPRIVPPFRMEINAGKSFAHRLYNTVFMFRWASFMPFGKRRPIIATLGCYILPFVSAGAWDG